ncbi:hypothetical protein DFH09DRAFT_1208899 [Mycena vulgaris]|nr:hypothetical protein DFH09DRAFT_1208899 [Mycena vulgaris]
MKTAAEILVDSYASNNDPPSDLDRTHLSQLLEQEKTTLGSLDAQITALRAQVLELRRLRTQTAKKIATLCVITSPLRVLPAELLSLIFMHCPRPMAHDEVLRPTRSLDVPLLLVQVCARWRSVALATPRLWAEFQIVLSHDPPRIQLLRYWLANANRHPISLAAKCYSPAAIGQVLTTTRRFKKLHLQAAPTSLYMLGARDYVRFDVEDLRIDIRHSLPDCSMPNTPVVIHGTYHAFQESSSLRSFAMLSSVTIGRSFFLKFSLPWAQLTHLRIVEWNLPMSSIEVLAQCINLVQCTFGRLTNWYGHIARRTTIRYVTDAHFIFESLDDPVAEEFFKSLTLPSLKRLIIESYDEDDEWTGWRTFASFRLRSSFNLETFELHGVTIGTADFLAFVECVPSVKNLTVMIPQLRAAPIFKGLTCDYSRVVLLPKLERLSIGLVNSEVSESLEPLIAMVRSRRNQEHAGVYATVSRLESLNLVSYPDTPAIDQWWWEWKLPQVFPELELTFDVCLPDVSLYRED